MDKIKTPQVKYKLALQLYIDNEIMNDRTPMYFGNAVYHVYNNSNFTEEELRHINDQNHDSMYEKIHKDLLDQYGTDVFKVKE